MKSFGENRLKTRSSDWEGRARISKKVRAAFWKNFKKSESKTIKVGEDAIGKTSDEITYALVVDNKVVKTGSKEDMLKLHNETKGLSLIHI